jgi:ABC-type uncharacterized transport system substrate-binding protein
MRRRELIALLGGAAAWPLAARAQQPAIPVIGFLRNTPPDNDLVAAFRVGLNVSGFREGQNVTIDYRWTAGQHDQLLAMAKALVDDKVAAIVAGGDEAIRAAKSSTPTIPIVFVSGDDPIKAGYVDSLRPDGNLTGATFYSGAVLGTKQLELLHSLIPTATTVALLADREEPTTFDIVAMQAAARSLGLQIHVVNASSARDFETAFASLAQLHIDAVVVAGNALFTSHRAQLVALAARYSVPVIYNQRGYARAGGLMSYGSSITTTYRQAGIYAGQILKGKSPADLPIMQPTKFDFVINLKAAKALGIDVPAQLLALADDTIE